MHNKVLKGALISTIIFSVLYELVALIGRYFIVRIAWVFGKNGNNFIKTMLKVGKKYDTVRVVNDQIGTPTYTFEDRVWPDR